MRADCGFDEVDDRRGRQRRRHLPRQRSATPSGCSPAATTTPCATAASTTGAWASSCRWPACASCTRQGRRLPFGFEVVGFAEEEGQRYKATFLGSGALTGHFDPAWLDQNDADGVTMREAMEQRRPVHRRHPQAAARRRRSYLGFVEVHIEQGPVLNELDLPLGIVTSINGSVRYLGEIVGMASHAGTTPMDRRRDAATAVAELALYVEKRGAARAATWSPPWACSKCPTARSTSCPAAASSASTSAPPPTRCATPAPPTCAPSCKRICERRGLHFTLEETMRAAAAPSAPAWQQRWERAVARARPAGAPHAQRRRPRRDEAARGDAAGDAVRARRRTPASATTRSNRSPTTTPSCACAPSRTCSNNLPTELP